MLRRSKDDADEPVLHCTVPLVYVIKVAAEDGESRKRPYLFRVSSLPQEALTTCSPLPPSYP